MPDLRNPSNESTRGQKTYTRRPLNSYYRSKSESSAPSPFRKKPPKRNRRKILLGVTDILLIGLVLVGMIYSLLLKSQPKIIVNDLSYHSQSVYQAKISSLFGGLKNGNKITFDEAVVDSKIQKIFPEVQSVRVELPFFSETPTVSLNVSKPVLKLANNGKVLVVDSQGTAVGEAAQLTNLANLITLNDQSGFKANVGNQVLSSESVAFIATVINQSKHAKVPLSTLSLPALPQELDLHTSDQPYFVKFYLGGDALIQSGQWLAARQKFAQTNQTPAQYLDVRIAGKIFYK